MSEHYTRNTESVLAWCNRCSRLTMHAVSAGRRGHCTEHERPPATRKKESARERRAREKRQLKLF